jgi:hypothetical protein
MRGFVQASISACNQPWPGPRVTWGERYLPQCEGRLCCATGERGDSGDKGQLGEARSRLTPRWTGSCVRTSLQKHRRHLRRAAGCTTARLHRVDLLASFLKYLDDPVMSRKMKILMETMRLAVIAGSPFRWRRPGQRLAAIALSRGGVKRIMDGIQEFT